MSYDPYYQDLINIWAKGGGWRSYYYGVFEKIINENNFKRVAEVGIGYGFHAKSILDNTKVDELFLIDPSQYYPNDQFATDVLNYGGFEGLVKNIKTHLTIHETRYTWFRQSSLDITNEQIADESLDAVFLDADHSYEAVSKDLPFWFKKVRKGGYLLGDDYQSCHPGVSIAVNEFVKNNNLTLEFLYKENTNYPIYKLIKS
jgi:hypothetical protein